MTIAVNTNNWAYPKVLIFKPLKQTHQASTTKAIHFLGKTKSKGNNNASQKGEKEDDLLRSNTKHKQIQIAKKTQLTKAERQMQKMRHLYWRVKWHWNDDNSVWCRKRLQKRQNKKQKKKGKSMVIYLYRPACKRGPRKRFLVVNFPVWWIKRRWWWRNSACIVLCCCVCFTFCNVTREKIKACSWKP